MGEGMGLTLEAGEAGPVYGPAAGGGLAGIVLVHGAEGPGAGWSHRFAAILAAQGLLALPVAYGKGDVFGAGPIREVDLGLLPEAGRALAAHPRCAGRVGLFGWSKGAEAAALVAGLMPEPFGAVALHAPPACVTGAADPAALRAGAALSRAADGPRAWVREGREAALAPGTPLPVGALPLLVSTGTADAIVPHAEALELARRAQGAGCAVELAVWEGQGHALDFDTEPALWARLTAFFTRHLRAA